jgi:transcription antitermination factor NusG
MKRLFINETTTPTTPIDVVSLSYTQSQHNNTNQQITNNKAVFWFPMRVTYHREMKIKALLDELGIESFVPQRYELVETKAAGKKRMLVPAIHNLIFVKSTQEQITYLKMTREAFAPMRYIMKRALSSDEKREILHVPDDQMNNFMRVASLQDDRIMFLDYSQLHNNIGKPVKIIDGYFAGVEGTIKRINRNKRVVVQIEGVAAVAIAFVPSSCLTLL